MDYSVCAWCKANNQPGATICALCGAPLGAADVVSDSGWREAPKLRDLEEFRFANSVVQIEGSMVPVAEINLAQGDLVYFEHHAMLWKDANVRLGQLDTSRSGRRRVHGMPYFVTTATGPGRIAFSRDAPGELVVLPLHPGMEIDVREHAFLVASHQVAYSYVRIKGLANVLHGGNGMYLDRFVTSGEPGVLMLHGNGDVMERTLAQGERIQVEPGGLLYKDSSVQMNAVKLDGVKTSMFGGGLYLAELVGPGRVGIQSMYHHVGTE